MKIFLPARLSTPVLLLLLVVLVLGCAPRKISKVEGDGGIEDAFNVESVTVFVEGRNRGVTPTTVNVVRSRGEYEVALVSGKEIVRFYEIGHGGDQRGPERHIINMDLERDLSGLGYRTFDLADLESPNDTLYIIPYVSQPISIDDRKYGLTIVITD